MFYVIFVIRITHHPRPQEAFFFRVRQYVQNVLKASWRALNDTMKRGLLRAIALMTFLLLIGFAQSDKIIT